MVAGDVTINTDGTVTATPIEFGATNLQSSDRLEHASKGAFGALIIEPPSAIISEFDTYRRAVATISGGTEGTFRELVLLFQNDVNMRTEQELTDGLIRWAVRDSPPRRPAPSDTLTWTDLAKDVKELRNLPILRSLSSMTQASFAAWQACRNSLLL